MSESEYDRQLQDQRAPFARWWPKGAPELRRAWTAYKAVRARIARVDRKLAGTAAWSRAVARLRIANASVRDDLIRLDGRNRPPLRLVVPYWRGAEILARAQNVIGAMVELVEPFERP